jgi:hypothetical protein
MKDCETFAGAKNACATVCVSKVKGNKSAAKVSRAALFYLLAIRSMMKKLPVMQ